MFGSPWFCTLITTDLFSLTIDSNHGARGFGPIPPVQWKCGKVKFPINLSSAHSSALADGSWN